MTRNAHDDARELIALAGTEEVPESRQGWLQSHLNECAACREYAEAAGRVVRSLRSLPVAADARLVRATQMRVRFHAIRLRETRERVWLIGTACVAVGISAAVSAPFVWRLFAWIGEWAGLSATTWQTGFFLFCIAPALLVSLLLLARGTHLASDRRNNQ